MRPLAVLLVVSVCCALSLVAAKQEQYDAQTAFRATLYSAAAYSNSPARCFPASWNFELTSTFSAPDGNGNTLFGFVGTNHDLKEVVVSFRGTSKPTQLVAEFFNTLTLTEVLDGDSTTKAFSYWVKAVDLLQNTAMPAVAAQLAKNPGYSLTATGHSLGAAMSSVFLTRLLAFELVPASTVIRQYTQGQPRVGNFDYAALHNSLPITSYRMTHYRDPVVHLPFCHGLITCDAVPHSDYAYHHGVEIFYAASDMPITASAKLCNGSPLNEDSKCSAGYFGDSLNDHLYYFNLHVGKYCPDSAADFFFPPHNLNATAAMLNLSPNGPAPLPDNLEVPPAVAAKSYITPDREIVTIEQAQWVHDRAARFGGQAVPTLMT